MADIAFKSTTPVVGLPIPRFDVTAWKDGATARLQSDDFISRWLLVVFVSSEMTSELPTDVAAFSERVCDFDALDCSVVVVSCVSGSSTATPPPCNVPLVTFDQKAMLKSFGLGLDTSKSALVLADPAHVCRRVVLDSVPVMRSVDENLRVLQLYIEHDAGVGHSMRDRTGSMLVDSRHELDLADLLNFNRDWAARVERTQPGYFYGLSLTQAPRFLWIGCSDSRVPANTIVGLRPGEVFVHRNIANQLLHTDFNALSVVQFAVDHLKVQHMLVVGHYGCGGVAASIGGKNNGLVDNWLRNIRDTYLGAKAELAKLPESRQLERLVELNVIRNALNLGQSTIVQDAWRRGQHVEVHALVYALKDGLLVNCNVTMASVEDVDRVCELFMSSSLPKPYKHGDIDASEDECSCCAGESVTHQ